MRLFALLLLSFSLVVAACSSGVESSEDPFVRLDAVEFSDRAASAAADGAVLIDLRTDEEMAAGFIDGAIQLDFYDPTFEDQLAELPRGDQYLIYCKSGNRSAATIRLMKDLGFTSVAELNGGMEAWLAAGLPVVIP